MTSYRVTARRAGEWWALEVPDLPGVFSQAKRLDKADEAAREAIAVMLDVETEDVEVTIEPVLPRDAVRAIKAAEKAEKAAEDARKAAQKAMQDAAATLTESLSQRDAGRVLGVSFQRVSQLLRARPTASSPKAAVKATKAGWPRPGHDERSGRQKRSQRGRELSG
ncbi:type II toxin-antitoxin system HicB family antitoxin [Streptomyces sp. NBC_01456]|uniref:type II toxin-antitoxin system HicB family antitoxin n=1 Tax=unclassified Streptomyces TaxID=2593676 RepID=UPI002E37A294|nr:MULTISPECIES: type II toxin-antitoxin system HicB family antitoxin [unclassified Streptomyces]